MEYVLRVPGGDWNPAPGLALGTCSSGEDGHTWEGASPNCSRLASYSLHQAYFLTHPTSNFCTALPGSDAYYVDLLLQPWLGRPLDLCHPMAYVQHFWCPIKHQFTGFLCTRPAVRRLNGPGSRLLSCPSATISVGHSPPHCCN